MKMLLLAASLFALPASAETLHVSHESGAQYATIQAAVNALPDSGGDIDIAPGIYREKLAVLRNTVHLHGTGATPADTVIVYGDSAATAGGTFKSFSVDVAGDDFRADNLTIQNDYWLDPSHAPSQAVALAITGDRAVLSHVRLLGHQDTLYANKGPSPDKSMGGRMARQVFSDCYIEGHVDFIFGNAKAWFERCELHGLPHSEVMFTAQSKNAPAEDSAYVFDHCTLTADPTAQALWLGRAWRPWATVIFLHADIEAPLMAAGWREWHPGETHTLLTATYAEYRSTGPGANPAAREPFSHQLTDAEAAKWSLDAFFAHDTAWIPETAR